MNTILSFATRWQENLIDPSSSILSEIQTNLLEIGEADDSENAENYVNDCNKDFEIMGKNEFYVTKDNLNSKEFYYKMVNINSILC